VQFVNFKGSYLVNYQGQLRVSYHVVFHYIQYIDYNHYNYYIHDINYKHYIHYHQPEISSNGGPMYCNISPRLCILAAFFVRVRVIPYLARLGT
jgi:hypothetical protein